MGPPNLMVKHPCSCCRKIVRGNQKALLCTGCKQWTHISCGRVSRKQYDDKSELFLDWLCPKCIFDILPFQGESPQFINHLNEMPRQKSHTLQNSSSRSKASVATFPKEKG